MTYRPQPKQEALLDAAWAFTESVPYQVSARWLFYRLLQDGWVSTKADYKRVISLLSKARKRFWKGWRPDTLADDSRDVAGRGHGHMTLEDWLYAIGEYQVRSHVDRWKSQPYYVIVCFEAAAMSGQFHHYLPSFVTRVAFKGDVSIPAKWEIADLMSWGRRRYNKAGVVIYFGDLDPKGLLIPESAMADVRAWSPGIFQYVRAGLNPGDEERYGIAENPERPGTYQWEALDDGTAGTLIKNAVAPYLDLPAGEACEKEDERRLKAFRTWWAEHKPTAKDLKLD